MSESMEMAKRILEELNQERSTYQAGDQILTGGTMKDALARQFREGDVPADVAGPMRLPELAQLRETVNRSWEVDYRSKVENHNPIKRFIRWLFRKLCGLDIPALMADQNEFNASTVRLTNLLSDDTALLAQYTGVMRLQAAAIDALEQQVREIRQEVISSRKSIQRQVTLLLEKLKEENDLGDIFTELDYGEFEKHFRGAESEIKERQKVYLPYFANASKVLDIGCGRGEFLELLREDGKDACGVDLYEPFVEHCRAKGLTVVNAEALAYLGDLEDGSIDGVFAGQIVEHMEVAILVQFCRKIYSKLAEGGVAIFETPNPQCLGIYTHAFYMDPSHTKPVHPLTLEYILRQVGFQKVEIFHPEYSTFKYRLPLLTAEESARHEEFNEGSNKLSDEIFGYQDYAAIAYK